MSVVNAPDTTDGYGVPPADYDNEWSNIARWDECIQRCLTLKDTAELVRLADFHETVAKVNALAPYDSCKFHMTAFRLRVAETLRQEISRRGYGER